MQVIPIARDGRDSPLKYTPFSLCIVDGELGMAGIHRSSTLSPRATRRNHKLGMAGIHRSSTLFVVSVSVMSRLGMAGIHRSSTLKVGRSRAVLR